jgi:hypothetical protein
MGGGSPTMEIRHIDQLGRLITSLNTLTRAEVKLSYKEEKFIIHYSGSIESFDHEDDCALWMLKEIRRYVESAIDYLSRHDDGGVAAEIPKGDKKD